VSHLFIGLAAFSLTYETYAALNVDANLWLCSVIGTATIAFYSVHRIMQLRIYQEANSKRISYLKNNKRTIEIAACIAIVLNVALIIYYFSAYIFVFLALAIASLVYLLPIMKRGRRVRDIPYLKIWVIAIAWSLVTVLSPVLIGDISVNNFSHLGIERFLFFLLITIPFDIRDEKDDEMVLVKTFKTLLSKNRLVSIGIFIGALISIFIWLSPFGLAYQIALQISAILACLLLVFADLQRPLWYYSFLIDGLIILRLVLFLAISNFI